MKAPTENQAAPEIVDVLADLVGCPSAAIRLRTAEATQGYDYWLKTPNHTFLVEYKSIASPGYLAHAVHELKRAAQTHPGSIPLVVTPHMPPRGRALCKESEMCWLDLSGNAAIVGPGLRILIEGRANKFLQPGRPSSTFAPKSSRVARQLLSEPQRFQTQAELARQTDLGDGFVSKIVARLVKEHYVVVNEARAVRPRDPDLLLDAWHAAYKFDRNRILIGQVPASSGEEVLHSTIRQLSRAKIDHAVTGLAAVWLYMKFAEFRLTTIYVKSMPSRALLKKIRFEEQPQGGNLWFVVPRDESVFHGSQQLAGVQCVSSLQALLDLKAHPEPAKEAASELRKKFLTWRQRGK